MAKKATITKNKYDKTHMKQYLLKYHLVNDADIIEKLSSVPNMQGYVRQLIRQDLAASVPVSMCDAARDMLQEQADKTGTDVQTLAKLIINEWLVKYART